MVSGSFVLRGDTCDDSQDKNTAPVTTEAQPRRARIFTISTSLEGIYVFRDPVVTILTRMSPSPPGVVQRHCGSPGTLCLGSRIYNE